MEHPVTLAAIQRVHRESWSRILATLIRQTRDLEAAEDALQEAMERALISWPKDGVPENPAGWVSTTGRRIAIDAGRRTTTLQGKILQLAITEEPDRDLHEVDLAFGDDRLRLIFTCCHPVLTQESRLALTLRMVCGLSTSDIAQLFLVQPTTMAARITRAKKQITASGVPYTIPSPADLDLRLNDVLAVVYLVATSAHTPGTGVGLHNTTHMQLALDLTRVLHELIPNHPEVLGLRALVLLAEARKDSRIDAAGNALSLEHMDRSLWDAALIAEAGELTARAMRLSTPDTVGSYTLQAAIAMVHAEAKSYEATDWHQITALYMVLDHRHSGAVVRLGYAIAIGMRDGAEAGLALIARSQLDDALAEYPMLAAAYADLHRRAGRPEEAARYYQRAAKLATNETLAQWFTDQVAAMRA